MKKYILFFAIAFGTAQARAQSQATGTQGQTSVNADSVKSSGNNSSHGTISRAGKNEHSVYTPPAGGTASSSDAPAAQMASPSKTESAVFIDPKKQH